jgi:hypothetical protein
MPSKRGQIFFALALFVFIPTFAQAHINLKDLDPDWDSLKIAPPPQFLRQPESAQVLSNGIGLQFSFANDAQTSATLINQGSMVMHLPLAPGWDMQTGFSVPWVTPFMGLRYQLLGQHWEHGPYVTLETMATAVPDLSAGVSVGGTIANFEPFAYARSGQFLDLDYYEGGVGVVLPPIGVLHISGGVSSRVSQADHSNIEVTTAGVALEFEFGPRENSPKKRRRKRREETEEDSSGVEDAAPAEPKPASTSL